jgi:hypothetical protein
LLVLLLQFWRFRWHVHRTYLLALNGPLSISSKKREFFVTNAVRSSNLTRWFLTNKFNHVPFNKF